MRNEKLKYFLFNKKSDYLRGFISNMEYGADGLYIGKERHRKSVFISRVLDSGEDEMNWHRIKIQMRGQDSGYKVFVYTSEREQISYNQQIYTWTSFIHSDDISLEEKRGVMEPYCKKEVYDMDDLLIHEVTGRYLWIVVELFAQSIQSCISEICIYFPKQSWIYYLPEIYQKEDAKTTFLERYLGIFQTLYEDIDANIAAVASMIDIDSAEGEFLNWLSEWLDVEESYIWSEEQLRRLLKHAVLLYKSRGTRQGISEMVELYTGEKPFIIENHQLAHFRSNPGKTETLEQLYGDNIYEFVVLVREECIHSEKEQKTLRRIIEDMKPAHTTLRLIILKPYMFLGRYSYLGVNSVLGKYTNVALNGHSSLSFAMISKEHTQNLEG